MSETELISRLKKTRLRGFGGVEVYKDADLRIIPQMDTSLLVPPQKYVLAPGVQTVLELADAFALNGIDIFQLRGAVFFWLEGSDPENDPAIPLLPPIVEESEEPDGRIISLINDGMHRIGGARKRGRHINIVLARNVPKEYPYYAYALTGGWDEVEEIPELTDGYKKKEYRQPENYKALFRDFNAQFPGVQAQRKQTQSGLKE